MIGYLNFYIEGETKATELKLWLVKRQPSLVLAGGGEHWVVFVVYTVALILSALRHDRGMVLCCQTL